MLSLGRSVQVIFSTFNNILQLFDLNLYFSRCQHDGECNQHNCVSHVEVLSSGEGEPDLQGTCRPPSDIDSQVKQTFYNIILLFVRAITLFCIRY